MATVTVFTAARMQAIEDATIVSGEIVGDDLILTANDSSTVNAGDVRGPAGPQGPIGEVSEAEMNAAIAAAHAAGAITGAMLASSAVSADKLAAASVTNVKLGPDAVTGAKIADGAIGIEHMTSNSVGNSQLTTDAVTKSKIAPGAVGISEILDDAILENHIAAGAVGNSQLASNAVTASKIAADAVNSSEIAANAVGQSELANADEGSDEGVRWARLGNMVTVWTVGSGTVNGVTIPSGFRPTGDYVKFPGVTSSGAYMYRITTSGAIDRLSGSWATAIGDVAFVATYAV